MADDISPVSISSAYQKSSQAPGESNMGSSHADSPPPVAVGIKVKPSTSTLKSDQDLTTASETSSSCLSDSESDTESGVLTQKSGMLPPGSKGTRSHISRGSRVTIKTPTERRFILFLAHTCISYRYRMESEWDLFPCSWISWGERIREWAFWGGESGYRWRAFYGQRARPRVLLLLGFRASPFRLQWIR